MKNMAKAIGLEEDPAIQAEIKAYQDILNGMKEQPTIEPKRKTGRWIVGANHGLMVHTLTCDQCNHSEVSSSVPNFCPNCGADMRGEQG